MKALVHSRSFQQGESSSRGLLRDCVNFADGSFAALNVYLPMSMLPMEIMIISLMLPLPRLVPCPGNVHPDVERSQDAGVGQSRSQHPTFLLQPLALELQTKVHTKVRRFVGYFLLVESGYYFHI